MQDYHLVDIRHEKVSPFVKFEIILPLLCFLLDPLTNKHCMQDMEFHDKLVDRFQGLSKVKNPAVSNGLIIYNYLEFSKQNVLRNMPLSH